MDNEFKTKKPEIRFKHQDRKISVGTVKMAMLTAALMGSGLWTGVHIEDGLNRKDGAIFNIGLQNQLNEGH